MTDSVRSYWSAALALLNATEGVTAYLTGDVPNTEAARPKVYAVLFPDLGRDGGARLSAHPHDQRWNMAVMHVGNTALGVGWLAERTRPALRMKRLTSGCTPLYLSSTGPLKPDDDLTPPPYTATDVWEFASPLAAS